MPSSLSDLLTPKERARRMSRRDSQDSFSASPRGAFAAGMWGGGERLAQSAGPTMGPGFLQGLWSAEGGDVRKGAQLDGDDFTFGPGTAQPHPRQSLLTQQKSPTSLRWVRCHGESSTIVARATLTNESETTSDECECTDLLSFSFASDVSCWLQHSSMHRLSPLQPVARS